MCGIIGYVGPRECKQLLIQGLERLEYRGYDSAGIALREADGLEYVRAVGNLQNLKEAAGPNGSKSKHGLGHTRWATHGGVTEANAHPLTGCDGSKMSIVLNGIVENYRELREGLHRRRAHVLLRDRRRDRLAPDRAPLRGRSHGGGPAHVRRARGPLHLRRHPPRPPRPARRRAPPDAARGRDRQRRDVPRVECGRVPEGDAPGAVPRRRRHRHDHPRGLRLHPRRRLPGRARPGRARLGRRGRREGRLRDVHAQGDLRAVRGRRRDDRRPRPSRHARARRTRAFRGGAQGAAPDRHPRVRHRVPRRASSAGT